MRRTRRKAQEEGSSGCENLSHSPATVLRGSARNPGKFTGSGPNRRTAPAAPRPSRRTSGANGRPGADGIVVGVDRQLGRPQPPTAGGVPAPAAGVRDVALAVGDVGVVIRRGDQLERWDGEVSGEVVSDVRSAPRGRYRPRSRPIRSRRGCRWGTPSRIPGRAAQIRPPPCDLWNRPPGVARAAARAIERASHP